MKILVTGFGPFPGTPVNPSADLIKMIDAGRVEIPSGCDIRTAILDTSWTGVEAELPVLFETHKPDFALHFGVADSANGFRIERQAHNRTQSRPDVNGAAPMLDCVCEGGPERIETGIDADAVTACLKQADIPAETSDDAGDYLCNMLLYLSLFHKNKYTHLADALFVHIPPGGYFKREDALSRGAAIILQCCANTLTRR